MAGSKTTRSKARFGLVDREDDMTNGLIKVKKEKCVTLPHPKRSHIDLIVKALGSRKQKTSEAIDFSLMNLSIEDGLGKLTSFSQPVSILCKSITYVNLSYLSLFFMFTFLSGHQSYFQFTNDLRIRAEKAKSTVKEYEKT